VDKTLIIDSFLTEKSLGDVLAKLFPDRKIEAQFNVPGSRLRIDYFVPSINLAIEYDGDRHYTSPITFKNDIRKQNWTMENGSRLMNEIKRLPKIVQRELFDSVNLLRVTSRHELFAPKQFWGWFDKQNLPPSPLLKCEDIKRNEPIVGYSRGIVIGLIDSHLSLPEAAFYLYGEFCMSSTSACHLSDAPLADQIAALDIFEDGGYIT
jgi:hypothetical protein